MTISQNKNSKKNIKIESTSFKNSSIKVNKIPKRNKIIYHGNKVEKRLETLNNFLTESDSNEKNNIDNITNHISNIDNNMDNIDINKGEKKKVNINKDNNINSDNLSNIILNDEINLLKYNFINSK